MIMGYRDVHWLSSQRRKLLSNIFTCLSLCHHSSQWITVRCQRMIGSRWFTVLHGVFRTVAVHYSRRLLHNSIFIVCFLRRSWLTPSWRIIRLCWYIVCCYLLLCFEKCVCLVAQNAELWSTEGGSGSSHGSVVDRWVCPTFQGELDDRLRLVVGMGVLFCSACAV